MFVSDKKNMSSRKKLVEEVVADYKNELKDLGTLGSINFKEKTN